MRREGKRRDAGLETADYQTLLSARLVDCQKCDSANAQSHLVRDARQQLPNMRKENKACA